MHKLYYFLCLLVFLLLMPSCNRSDDNYAAYFGGEVQNPKVRYVLFSRGNTVLDTIPLDKNNSFFIKFDSLTPGLYSFKHEPEYQYVYFEKNDSLMVAINADDFDQSIVFSGRGEGKNNFMMELSLEHEKDRSTGILSYDKAPAQFIKSIDSTYAIRKAFYKKSKAAMNWSDEFDFYAKNRVDLNYYTKKEYYPYVHERRTGIAVRRQLPEDYYDYRKNIDFDDTRLTGFSPFVRYYTAMLNNMAVANVKDASISSENALRDNIAKLNIADSVFTNESIRNQVLDNIAFSYLLEDTNIQHNRKFLERYLKLSTDKNEANEIHKIGRAIGRLNPGSPLPQIPLITTAGQSTDIMCKKSPTIIFFWTTVAKSQFEQMYKRAFELKKKHPSIHFIAVNVDNDEQWKRVISRYNFPAATQLRATDFTRLREDWVFTKIDRTIVLNADGTIKNAFANLLDTNFEKELK
ncbi:MAG: TlpA family protein disulfide reductase [Flavobacterium sp.]